MSHTDMRNFKAIAWFACYLSASTGKNFISGSNYCVIPCMRVYELQKNGIYVARFWIMMGSSICVDHITLFFIICKGSVAHEENIAVEITLKLYLFLQCFKIWLY